MFNYLTRVADGTGVEADYGTELPRFEYRGVTESVPRPGPEEWPPVDRSIDLLAELPDAHAAWHRWREYIVESPGPIPGETRRQLQVIAARNACDGTMDSPNDSETGSTLSKFADKVSRTPWLMGQSDVDSLRTDGMDDLAILHVIAVVAYQSAESRLRIGLSALARSED